MPGGMYGEKNGKAGWKGLFENNNFVLGKKEKKNLYLQRRRIF